MKKAGSVLIVLCLFVSLLTGCSFSPLDYIKEKGVEVNPAAVIDKTQYTWPQAYGEVLNVYLSRCGVFNEAKDKDGEVVSRSGVFFAYQRAFLLCHLKPFSLSCALMSSAGLLSNVISMPLNFSLIV